jgi:hypothetical protein
MRLKPLINSAATNIFSDRENVFSMRGADRLFNRFIVDLAQGGRR